LSPSELTYLFEGCKYCFSLKVKHGIAQPSMPMPGIFSAIAVRQKEFYAGKRTEEFCPELPAGVIEYGEKRVESVPLTINSNGVSCYIKGRFDLVVKFDGGGYGVIDCKTASPSDSKTLMYGRQLQAYTYALENPASGQLSLKPIIKLGLLYFEPAALEQISHKEQAFRGKLIWHEVLRDDRGFFEFMQKVINMLESDEVLPHTCEVCEYCKQGNLCLAGKPEAYEKGCTCCRWCVYRHEMSKLDATGRIPLKDLSIEKAPACPICDGQMVKREGKFGIFWSCVRYPDCKGTRNIATLSKREKADNEP